jgi:adenylate cyclase
VVDLLDRVYDVVEHALIEHNPIKTKFTADEVMIVFGDADTAVRAARAIHADLTPLVSEEGIEFGMGVNSGQVVEGMIGSSGAKAYDVIGDAVNIAKRIEGKATGNEILISDRTREYMTEPVELCPARVVKAEGRHRAVTVYSLCGARVGGDILSKPDSVHT